MAHNSQPKEGGSSIRQRSWLWAWPGSPHYRPSLPKPSSYAERRYGYRSIGLLDDDSRNALTSRPERSAV